MFREILGISGMCLPSPELVGASLFPLDVLFRPKSGGRLLEGVEHNGLPLVMAGC